MKVDKIKIESRLLGCLAKKVYFFLYRFLFLYRFRLDKHSEIADILKEGWRNYTRDLYPKDRRMDIFREKDIIGWSTENIRYLINEIVRRYAKGGNYMEIGTYKGGSLLSAALFNPHTRCIGIDNFSEFNEAGDVESVFKGNLAKFNLKNIEFYKINYHEGVLNLTQNNPDLKFDVYYYDGKHDYHNQLQGLKIILPYLKNRCVLMVDDINWEPVAKANKEFLHSYPEFHSVFRVLTKGNKSRDWWNGFEVITRGI